MKKVQGAFLVKQKRAFSMKNGKLLFLGESLKSSRKEKNRPGIYCEKDKSEL